jgi:hypothetical protein
MAQVLAAPFPDVKEQDVPTIPSSLSKSCQPASGRYIAELTERQGSRWPLARLNGYLEGALLTVQFLLRE